MLRFTGAVGYGSNPLVSNIDLHLKKGELILLEGPNGAGKTTLGLTLMGVLKPVKGSLESSFSRVSYVPQAGSFDRQYPICLRTVVKMGLRPHFRDMIDFFSATKRKNKRTMIDNALERVSLSGAGHLNFRQASGGQLQRALIARALISKPDLIIMDEPFANLDLKGLQKARQVIMQMIEEHNSTIMIIDHPRRESKKFYSRHLLLERDVTAEDGRMALSEV